MFFRRDGLTKEQRKQQQIDNFKQNMPRYLTVKFGLIIWVIGTNLMIYFFGNRATLLSIFIFFIISMIAGYFAADWVYKKQRNKVLEFYGIQQDNPVNPIQDNPDNPDIKGSDDTPDGDKKK
jgi:uncharacterized protein YacL